MVYTVQYGVRGLAMIAHVLCCLIMLAMRRRVLYRMRRVLRCDYRTGLVSASVSTSASSVPCTLPDLGGESIEQTLFCD